MGNRKSPAKWIKSVLFGKKSSKSTNLKVREKFTNEKEVLVAAKASEADVVVAPLLGTHPSQNPTDRDGKLELESKEVANISNDGGISLQASQDIDSKKSILQDEPCDPEKIRQQKAATMAQAAFRGYLARRAFWALKGIIRLQALIRGHLVRRQAIATLCCVMGIVKLQAHIRGRRVRHSDIRLELHKKCKQFNHLESDVVCSTGVSLPARISKLSANAFAQKILASSPTVMPLHLHYDATEPNSASNWLERWSASHFWKPVPPPKKISESKPQKKQVNGQAVESETARPKRSVRRIPAANLDGSAVQATSEFEKPKRNLRKASSHSHEPTQENPQSELEKVKRNLRKVHNPTLENSVHTELEFEKPKQSPEKVSSTTSIDIMEENVDSSGEKLKKETVLTVSTSPEVETAPAPLEMNEMSELSNGDPANINSKPLTERSGLDGNIPITNGDSNRKEDFVSPENQKSSRKGSNPAKQERSENGLHSSPTLPSYMAATESAKAKLRLQGSPRSAGQDGSEKSNVTRRHSLPSSTNNKISSQSPRTQRLVHAGGKGGSKSDRSTLSSRDGNAKVQVEWRR